MRWAPLALLAALAGAALPATAHERRVSYSSWDLSAAGARITARVSWRDLSQVPWPAGADDQQLGAYVADRLTLASAAGRCAIVRPPQRRADSPARAAFTWEVACPSADGLELRSDLLWPLAPSHQHLARVRLASGEMRERLLTAAAPSWALGKADGGSAGESIWEFVRLGAEHIASGYDHLIFLCALLLFGGSLGDIVRIVTGFTLAHSLTLALAVSGLVRAGGESIEALIGLSIALVAAENLWLVGARRPAARWGLVGVLLSLAAAAALGRGNVSALTLAGVALFAACYFGVLAQAARPVPLRVAVAFLFGLVHGFGFAGVLLEAALPSERVLRALFGFNLGVELAQVACVLALWPLLRYAARHQAWHTRLVDYGSAAILTVGVYWFASRCYA